MASSVVKSIRIPVPLWTEVEVYAAACGSTPNGVVGAALTHFLARIAEIKDVEEQLQSRVISQDGE